MFDRDSRVDDFAKSALRVGAVFASSPSFREDVVPPDTSSADVVTSAAPLDTPAPTRAPVNIAPAAPAPVAPMHDAFAAGAFLAPAMSSVQPGNGMFPTEVGPVEPAVEPSSLVVSSDLGPEGNDKDDAPRAAIQSDPFAIPGLVPNRGRAFLIAGACAAFLALVGATALVMGRSTSRGPTVAALQKVDAPKKAEIEIPPPPPVEVAAPAEAAPEPAPAKTEDAAKERASEPARDVVGKDATDPKKRFGKLTIKADGKTKNVWFDGKRMLGKGNRSFLVFCGMHTIAVNDKGDAKDIEVPCNGEYVVSSK